MSMFLPSIKPFWCSTVMIAIFLAALAGSPSEAQDKDPGEKAVLNVTILLYSGRPDPTYKLDDRNAIERLKTLISAAKINEKFERSTVIPAILGYKGIIVDNPDKITQLPAFLAVYKGSMEVKDEGKRFLIDEGGAVENLLLNMALEKKVIDERVFETIKSGR